MSPINIVNILSSCFIKLSAEYDFIISVVIDKKMQNGPVKNDSRKNVQAKWFVLCTILFVFVCIAHVSVAHLYHIYGIFPIIVPSTVCCARSVAVRCTSETVVRAICICVFVFCFI